MHPDSSKIIANSTTTCSNLKEETPIPDKFSLRSSSRTPSTATNQTLHSGSLYENPDTFADHALYQFAKYQSDTSEWVHEFGRAMGWRRCLAPRGLFESAPVNRECNSDQALFGARLETAVDVRDVFCPVSGFFFFPRNSIAIAMFWRLLVFFIRFILKAPILHSNLRDSIRCWRQM